MKDVLFESQIDLDKRKKTFSIDSKSEDQQCKTQVKKSFTYLVDTSGDRVIRPRDPLIFIRKSFDTKRGIEEFSFHVKGYFFVTNNDVRLKVLFHHMLDIRIKWKAKDFSPKKSASLT